MKKKLNLYIKNDIKFIFNDDLKNINYGFIYRRVNLKNGKIYIGQRRFYKYKSNDIKYSGSGLLLHRAIKKYGIENFTKEVLEYCETKQILNLREDYYAIENNSYYPSGYNIAKCGNGYGGDTFTNHPDKENIRKRMSESQKERDRSTYVQPKGKKSKMYKRIKTDQTILKQKASLLKYYETHNSPFKGKTYKHSIAEIKLMRKEWKKRKKNKKYNSKKERLLRSQKAIKACQTRKENVDWNSNDEVNKRSKIIKKGWITRKKSKNYNSKKSKIKRKNNSAKAGKKNKGRKFKKIICEKCKRTISITFIKNHKCKKNQ